MTLRALARGSLLYTAANLIPRLGAFLLLPLLTRILGRADFGTVSLVGSGALLLATMLRLGFDSALLRLHFDLDERDRRDLYATVAAISAVAAIGMVALVALVAPVVLAPSAATLAIIGTLTGALAAHQYLPSVWLRATEQPRRFLMLSVASFAVVVAATLALVVAIRFGAVGAVLAQLAGAAVLAAAGLALLVRLRPWRFRAALARRALGFGLPLVPHALGGWLLNVSDRWMLGLLLGVGAGQSLAAIGVYSLGYQLGYAVGLVAISFNAAWLPLFYRLGEGPSGPAVLRSMTTVSVAGMTVIATAIAALAPELVLVMAGPAWQDAADVAAVVSFGSVANAIALMLTGVLYLTRRTRIVPLLTLGAAALNLAANLVLIPSLGIMGAAWATLLAYALLAALTWAAARRRYAVDLDARRLAAIVLVGAATALVARFVGPEGGSGAAAAWHLVAAAAGCGGIALVSRLPIAELRGLLAVEGPAPGEKRTVR